MREYWWNMGNIQMTLHSNSLEEHILFGFHFLSGGEGHIFTVLNLLYTYSQISYLLLKDAQ